MDLATPILDVSDQTREVQRLDLGLSHRELEPTATTFLSNVPVNHRQYWWSQSRQSKLGFLNGVSTLGHLEAGD
jgi:hypothetical protein